MVKIFWAVGAVLIMISPSLMAMEPKFQQEFTNGDELKLDWVWSMNPTGPNLFVVSHRDGDINVFKRDVATGAIAFQKRIDVNEKLGHQGRHLDGYTVLTPQNFLYITGA